jgi:hypothetical protein
MMPSFTYELNKDITLTDSRLCEGEASIYPFAEQETGIGTHLVSTFERRNHDAFSRSD